MYDFQKASMWKRISAALFDFIILCTVVVGFALLLSVVVGYDGYVDNLEAVYNEYEEKYEVDFDAKYDELTEEQKNNYDTAKDTLLADERVHYNNNMVINFTFVIVTFSILLAYLLLEFLVPLLFKNGQTLGKKIFGIAVMREDGVKITPMVLFVRTVLGKYTLETMIPVLILIMLYLGIMGIIGLVAIVGLLIAQVVLLIVTKARTPLHDKISYTVVVDYASQMIFDSTEDLIAYKKKIHAEQVEAEKN
ncbi:MAG: RDD family protein [Ruminococcaceae bacterium]|nr:RDD family protein [Oscillospiraceae bacterium]